MSDPSNSGNNNNQQPNQQSQQGQQQQGQQQTFTFTGNGGNAAANGSIWIYPVGPTYTITLGDVGGGGTCEAAPKKKNTDGCVCKKCKELYPYAEPNQSDGTLICYGCRMVW